MNRIFLALLIFMVSVNNASALSTSFTVKERASVARTDAHINYSVILAESENVTSTSALGITGQDATFKVLSRFGGVTDTSKPIKSVLVDFQDDFIADATNTYTLTDSGSGDVAGSNLATEDASYVYVDTGVATFQLSKTKGSLFDEVIVGSTTLVTSGADNGMVLDVDRAIYSSANAIPDSVTIVDNNALYTSIMVKGTFEDASSNTLYPQDTSLGATPDTPIRYTYLYYFYKGKSSAKIIQTLQNENFCTAYVRDTASVKNENLWLYSLKSEVKLNITGTKTVTYNGYSDTYTAETYTVEQTDNAHNGFDAKTYDFTYDIKKAGVTTGVTGAQYNGGIMVTDTTGGMAINPRWFWQNYPSELSVTNETVSYIFLPERDVAWNGMTPPAGYTMVDSNFWLDAQQEYRFIPGRWKSWHTVYNFFEGTDAQNDELAFIQKPLVIKQPINDIADSNFFGSQWGTIVAPVVEYTDGATLQETIDFYEDEVACQFDGTLTIYDSFQEARSKRTASLIRWTKDSDSSVHYSYGSWYGWDRFGGSPRQWGYGYNSQHYDFAHQALMAWLHYDNWDAFEMYQEFSEHLLDRLMLKDPDAIYTSTNSIHGSETYEQDALNDYYEDIINNDQENSAVGSDHIWSKPIFLNYLFTGDERYRTVMEYNVLHAKRLKDGNKYNSEHRNTTRMVATALDHYQITGDSDSLDLAWYIWNKLLIAQWVDIDNSADGLLSDRVTSGNTTTGYTFFTGYGAATIQYMARLYKILQVAGETAKLTELETTIEKWAMWVRDRAYPAYTHTQGEGGYTPGTYYESDSKYKPYSSWQDLVAPSVDDSDVSYEWRGQVTGGQVTVASNIKENNTSLGYSGLFYLAYAVTGESAWLDLGRVTFKDRFLYGLDDRTGNSEYPLVAIGGAWPLNMAISTSPGSSWKNGIFLSRPEYNMEVEYKISQGWTPESPPTFTGSTFQGTGSTFIGTGTIGAN